MSTFKDVAIENSITAGTVEHPIMPSEDNELVTKKYADNVSAHYIVDSQVSGDVVKYTYNDGTKEMYYKYRIENVKTESVYGSLYYTMLEIPIQPFFNNITYVGIRDGCSAGLHSLHLMDVTTDTIPLYLSNALGTITLTVTFYIHLIGN